MYEAPIDVYTISNEMSSALDDEIVTVVQRFGFDVNKEELTKALLYDRDQYRKGYEDGRPPKGEWEDKWNSAFKCDIPYCSNCKKPSISKFNYCPNCGAMMSQECNT